MSAHNQDGPDETHAWLEAAELSAGAAYRLMTDIIAPRPIAWVSTVDGDGRRNLAPFSYYQAVCSSPPTIVLGIGWPASGRPKDTLANILSQREFTVCHVDRASADAMQQTSANVGPEVDEWTMPGVGDVVTPVPSRHVAPPRIAEAHAALECRLVHAIPLGEGPTGQPSSTLVIAQVVCFVVRRSLLTQDAQGRQVPIDPGHLRSVGRMGGIAYTTTHERFELPRAKTGGAQTLGPRLTDK